jgi:hypothetical protein
LVYYPKDFLVTHKIGKVYVSVIGSSCFHILTFFQGRRACEVRSSWLGKGPSRLKNYFGGYARYPSVHRFKVDERRGFFITTHGLHNFAGQGQLQVSDINDGTAIWGLDPVRIPVFLN